MNRRILVGALAFALLLSLTLPLLAEQFRGKVASVNLQKNQLVVTESFKNWTFQLDQDVQIFVNDRQSKLAELQSGDEAIVTFTRQGDRYLASVVRCLRK